MAHILAKDRHALLTECQHDVSIFQLSYCLLDTCSSLVPFTARNMGERIIMC